MTFILSDNLINSKIQTLNSSSFINFTQSIYTFTESIYNFSRSLNVYLQSSSNTILSQNQWLIAGNWALNFTGSGVSASLNNKTASIFITTPQSASYSSTSSYHPITILSQSVWLGYGDFALNFTGSAVSSSITNNTASIFINTGGASSGFVYNKVLVVDPSGSDVTGTRGRPDLPFATPASASAAALNGDLIIINPGTYVTNTNIAKDGVDFYVYSNTNISVAGTSSLYNITGFTTGSKIFGSGKYTTTSTGVIYYSNNVAVNQVFEFDTITSTVSAPIVMSFGATTAYYGLIRGNKITTNNGHAIYFPYGGCVFVDVPYIETTHNNASSHCIYVYNGNMILYINSAYVASTHSSTYGIAGLYNGTYYFNIGSCTGYAYVEYVNITFNGNCSRVTAAASFASGICTHNGVITSLTSAGAGSVTQVNGRVTTLTVSAGTVFASVLGIGTHTLSGGAGKVRNIGNGFWSISGGSWYIEHGTDGGDYFQYAITGGTVDFQFNKRTDMYYTFIIVNGNSAKVSINGLFVSGRTYYSYYDAMIRLLAGTMSLNAVIGTTYTGSEYTLIGWGGGLLNVDYSKLIVGTQNNPPIISALTTSRNGIVTFGATNFTGSFWTSRKAKDKLTVTTAAATTSISLTDGSGAPEQFLETDTVTYNTKALMAQRIAALINASVTLDITATQDTPGTDAYFYIEADYTGSIATAIGGHSGLYNLMITATTNLSSVPMRLAHNAPVDVVSGRIWIENQYLTV